MINRFLSVIALAMTLTMSNQVTAQVQTEVPPVVPGAQPVTMQHIKVHGAALEGNLEGDAVDRDVLVYLPPSYNRQKSRRYPVVYALHGYSIGAEQWVREIPQFLAMPQVRMVKQLMKDTLSRSTGPASGLRYQGAIHQFISCRVVGMVGVKIHASRK